MLGQTRQAKAEYEAIPAETPMRLARLALLAARTGDRAEAERRMAQMKRLNTGTFPFQYGQIYAQLGDRDRAFAEFDIAIRTKEYGLALLKMSRFLDPIRGDPRYAALLRRLRFP
jgi:hypothetical protein